MWLHSQCITFRWWNASSHQPNDQIHEAEYQRAARTESKHEEVEMWGWAQGDRWRCCYCFCHKHIQNQKLNVGREEMIGRRVKCRWGREVLRVKAEVLLGSSRCSNRLTAGAVPAWMPWHWDAHPAPLSLPSHLRWCWTVKPVLFSTFTLRCAAFGLLLHYWKSQFVVQQTQRDSFEFLFITRAPTHSWRNLRTLHGESKWVQFMSNFNTIQFSAVVFEYKLFSFLLYFWIELLL